MKNLELKIETSINQLFTLMDELKNMQSIIDDMEERAEAHELQKVKDMVEAMLGIEEFSACST